MREEYLVENIITWHLVLFDFIPLWALIVDFILGETNRFHPLVGFGNQVLFIERFARNLPFSQKISGGIGWVLAVLPLISLISFFLFLIKDNYWLFFIANLFILYFTLGCKSLLWHSREIFNVRDNIELARKKVAMIVSRNTEKMDETQIASAAIESVLENGNDAVIGALFWFALLGAPGAILFRLANTLDAMWGYKNSRYLKFGYVAAKMDDILGYIPARLSALLYCFCGNYRQGFDCWKTQAKLCKSPNGGPAMCAGAGALNITIGGPAFYDGKLEDKILMGLGKKALFNDIPRANKLVFFSSLSCALILSLF